MRERKKIDRKIYFIGAKRRLFQVVSQSNRENEGKNGRKKKKKKMKKKEEKEKEKEKRKRKKKKEKIKCSRSFVKTNRPAC